MTLLNLEIRWMMEIKNKFFSQEVGVLFLTEDELNQIASSSFRYMLCNKLKNARTTKEELPKILKDAGYYVFKQTEWEALEEKAYDIDFTETDSMEDFREQILNCFRKE